MGTSELTKKDVWLQFRDNYMFYLDEEAPIFIGKTSKLFSLLCEEQGLEKTNNLLTYVCKNWKKLKEKYKLNGYPNMGMIWGFRQSFLEDMRNHAKAKLKNKSPKRSGDTKSDTSELYFDS